jgi:sugar transferase (PEP-CTERM/EpsH1 system associated)
MKLLFLAHRMPFPPNKGDKIRSFNILKFLAKQHDVYLACLVDDVSDLRFIPDIERLTRRLVFERIHPRTKKLLSLRSMLRLRPITIDYFYSKALQSQIDNIIDTVDFDAFICFSSPMAEYLYRSRHANNKIRRTLRVMDLIDVDSTKWKQYAEQSRWLTSYIYRYEAYYLATYEQCIAQYFHHVLVVTEHEKNAFPGGATQNLEAMSNGVDLEYFNPNRCLEYTSVRPTLVFTGMMDYFANIDGMTWFVEAVFPLVQAAVPDVELLIVGSKPAQEIKRMERLNGIVVTGYVDDVREYLSRATVCIVPLRIARGIQNKVLEAMAMGKAVVCTPQAHEGISAIPDKEIVVADEAEIFATKTISLLRDKTRTNQIGLAARQYVENNYSWDKNMGVLERLLDAKHQDMQTIECMPKLTAISEPTQD